jgi:hypothetical protein
MYIFYNAGVVPSCKCKSRRIGSNMYYKRGKNTESRIKLEKQLHPRPHKHSTNRTTTIDGITIFRLQLL